MSRVLRSIRVTFTREGIEFAVTSAHPKSSPRLAQKYALLGRRRWLVRGSRWL
jgi:hypothetical protein